MTSFFLVRHGETVWNVQKRIQGSSDSPLTVLGKKQAERNGVLLAQHEVSQLYASPLVRVQKTVECMQASLRDAKIEFDDRLREIDQGAWEGLTWKEVQSRYRKLANRQRRDYLYSRAPGGESRADVLARAVPFVRELLARWESSEGTFAIVSHGLVIRLILEHMLDMDVERQHRFHVWNSLVYRIDVEASGNVVTHYLNGEGPYEGLHTNHL